MTTLDIVFLVGMGFGVFFTILAIYLLLRKYLGVAWILRKADKKSIPLFIFLTADKYIFLKLPERIRSGFAEVLFAGQRYLFNLKKGTRFILRGVPTYIVTDMAIPALSFKEIIASEKFLDEYYWETVLKDHVNEIAQKCGIKVTIDTPYEMLNMMGNDERFAKALLSSKIAYQNSPYSIEYLLTEHHRQKPSELFSILEQYATELQLRVIGLKKLEALRGINWKALLTILMISVVLLIVFMMILPAIMPGKAPTPPVGQGIGG